MEKPKQMKFNPFPRLGSWPSAVEFLKHRRVIVKVMFPSLAVVSEIRQIENQFIW